MSQLELSEHSHLQFGAVQPKPQEHVLDAAGVLIAISGLGGPEFDNRGSNEASSTASPSSGPALFFAARINGYAGGLFGTLTPVRAERAAEDHE
jgi:hypothetical protein